jgi:hypothetical protein
MEKLKNQLAGIAALVGVLGEKQNNKIAVLEKTIQVLELNIKELKLSGKNPLAN